MIKRVFNNIIKRYDISVLYNTSVGIKCLNQLLSSNQFKYLKLRTIEINSLDELHICFDGLKDKHTLLNRSIPDSPFFEIVSLLYRNKQIDACEYVERIRKGTLDFRPARKINQNFISYLESKFSEKIKLISTDSYEPVFVINVKNKLFIANGKHTAATCGIIGVLPKCVEISSVVHDSFLMWVYRKMLKDKDSFRIHLNFFKNILDQK